MKNKMIKMVGIFAVMLVVTLCYVTAAEAKTVVSGKCGESLTWTYDKKTKTFSITGKGDMYDYNGGEPKFGRYVEKARKVIIGKNVGVVRDATFVSVDPDNDVSVEIKCDVTDFEYESIRGFTKIKLCGSAENLGRAMGGYACYVTQITKSKGNDKIKIKDNMVLSSDGKRIYLYYGNDKTLRISDRVVSISGYSFMGAKKLRKVILGKNVKTIGRAAFYELRKLKTVKCNGRLKEIGEHAFASSKLEKIVSLPKGISIGQQAFELTKIETVTLGNNTKVGIMAFPAKTTVRARKNFKKIRTSVGKAYFMQYDEGQTKGNSMELKWSKVEGAEGYEIILQQGDYVKRWRQTKSYWSTSTVGDIPIEQFNLEDSTFGMYWFAANGSASDERYTQKNPIYVKVRAYRTTKKGKIIYTKWSNSEQILECDVPD